MGKLIRKKTAAKKKKKRLENGDPSKAGSDQKKAGTDSGGTGGSQGRNRINAPMPGKSVSQEKKLSASKSLAIWTQAIQFLREVKAELKKVTWPTRKQTLGSTSVVIIIVLIVSFYLGLVDMGLSFLMRLVLKH